jgi:adenine-specific DNA-methyltransferase
VAKAALPLLVLNSVTMLGAEVKGRSYGGGILKMEPKEAASLPVPNPADLLAAWAVLKGRKSKLERQLRDGRWTNVAKEVDQVLLHDVMGLDATQVVLLHEAARSLRERRIGSPTASDASA